jgi:hypothetical protein
MRAPNEIDFWRGFALVTIFINHVPGIYFEKFTYRNVSLADSAELFVFLAGWSMRRLAEGGGEKLSADRLVLRLISRAFTLYIAQTLITEIAIALLAGAAIWLDAPFLLDWHNASAVFRAPVEAHVGLVLLTHQLGYFNILPLYVVLMVAAPIVALLHRLSPGLLLALSVAIYAAALISGVNLPTWPVEGTWFLNPLTWQLIYVLGFLLGADDGLGAWARRHRRVLRWAALPVLVACVVVAQTRFSPDPIRVPAPKLVFMFDKTFLSPTRLIDMLALAAFFAGSRAPIARLLPRCSDYLAMLGRNSLNVFCVASLLSLAGQVFRFAYGSRVATDLFLVIVGLVGMGLTGWLSEWRDRLRAKPAALPAAGSLSPSSP